MKKLLAAMLATGIALTAVGPAEAAGGCGRGFHPGPRGICRPNGPPVYAHRGPPRAGYYYRGRGYWNNGRYWQHRYRYRNGWRYR